MHYKLSSYLIGALSLLLFSACEPTPDVENPSTETVSSALPLQEGSWRIVLDISAEHQIPFLMKIAYVDSSYSMVVVNNTEQIDIDDVRIDGDSVFVRMPFFDSQFKGKIESSSAFSGQWYNYNKGADYKIPFRCVYDAEERFPLTSEDVMVDLAGQWEVTFSPNAKDSSKAIGKFNQFGTHLFGTFITETGDYRFLDGVAVNDSLYLSCFDGSHAFLFKAALEEGATLNGQFWSGKHWQEPWTAVRNENFTLRNPDSLTFLKEGYDALAFSFPDLNNTMVSLADEKYQDKIVVVQIMGSWCPNCMDESELYADLYKQYNASGLEIIALAFEASDDFEEAVKDVSTLKTSLDADYDFLIAGVANKAKASEALPMLNQIMSYPTSIFIDRKGNIRKIHTGFYGPGTEEYYEEYVDELTLFLEDLIAE